MTSNAISPKVALDLAIERYFKATQTYRTALALDMPTDAVGESMVDAKRQIDSAVEAYAAQAVAAERERWLATGKALLSAHDASLVRVGKMMQERNLTSMRVPPELKAEFDAIAELRALVSPNHNPAGASPV